ncbi:MAG: DUF2844 domain-containing protein [Candidatus Korobacteraceae bacterium]
MRLNWPTVLDLLFSSALLAQDHPTTTSADASSPEGKPNILITNSQSWKTRGLGRGSNGNWATRLTLIGAVLVLAFPAWASLGDNVNSVQNDWAHMQGSLRSVAMQSYVEHEIRIPTGQVVREFVSPAGKVFGVAWQGSFLPDLKQLLGSYFVPMKHALSAQQGHGRRSVSIDTADFVFQQGGHARNFHGRAYVPSLVPQGVDATLIQ